MASKQKSTKSTKKNEITPLGDRVLVKPLGEEDNMSPSGIIIPDTAKKEKPEQGEVIAIGPGKINEKGDVVPVRVAIGSRVVFSKYGYDEIKVNDEEYYILKEDQILAVIK